MFPENVSRRYRVAVVGYFGFGNLGDELLAEAAVSALERCGVERGRTVILSNDPADSRRKFGTEAVDRWKPLEVFRALRQSDTLLFGGGGLFQDVTSLRCCLYYWGVARMARFCGAVTWALGQSVGPLSTRAGRFLTREALGRCRVVQVRDEVSRLLCEETGISVLTGHDPVFSLEDTLFPKTNRPLLQKPLQKKNKTLLNLRPCAGDLALRFARAVGTSASPDTTFVGVALAKEDERLMRFLIGNGDLPPMPVERVFTPEDAAHVWNGATGALGMRLHFAVLSALAGTPLALVPYDPKVTAFAEAWTVPIWDGSAPPIPAFPVAPRGFPSFGELRGQIDCLCRAVLGES